VGLIYRTEPRTEKVEEWKKLKMKMDMLRSIGKQSGSPEEVKEGYGGKDL